MPTCSHATLGHAYWLVPSLPHPHTLPLLALPFVTLPGKRILPCLLTVTSLLCSTLPYFALLCSTSSSFPLTCSLKDTDLSHSPTRISVLVSPVSFSFTLAFPLHSHSLICLPLSCPVSHCSHLVSPSHHQHHPIHDHSTVTLLRSALHFTRSFCHYPILRLKVTCLLP